MKKSRYEGKLRKIIENGKIYSKKTNKKCKRWVRNTGKIQIRLRNKKMQILEKDEEKICRLCKEEEEDILHVMQKRKFTGEESDRANKKY